MIAKQAKGSGFRGCLNYLLDKTKDAEIIGGNMSGQDARRLATEFGMVRNMRPSLGKAVYHVSLSVAADDVHLHRGQWSQIADRYMRDMGFGESQYILIGHHNTDHQHVHIVANRVNIHGKTVSAENDYRRAAESLQGIEKEFGLQQTAMTPSQARRRGKGKAPRQGEYQMMVRTEKPSNRLQLQVLVDVAAKRNPTMSQFINRLHRTGVGVMPHIQSTGRVQGISFEINGAAFKGSSLGKAYSFNGLQNKLGVSYEAKRDFKALEEAVSGGKKKELARVERLEREHKEIGQALSTTKKERDEAVEEVREKDTKIDAMQTANAQSQKLLKEAGETNKKLLERDKKLQKDLTEKDQRLEEKDKKLEEAGDPAELEKVVKENELLKKALENYKQALDQQDRGRGQELE